MRKGELVYNYKGWQGQPLSCSSMERSYLFEKTCYKTVIAVAILLQQWSCGHICCQATCSASGYRTFVAL